MRKLKGFSLIELLVAMAIIAVLLGLVGFGISTAQRNSRDSQRRQKLSDIKLVLEDYNSRNNGYPAVTGMTSSASSLIVDTTNPTTGTVTFSGPTLNIGSGITTGSTSTGTEYCYGVATTGGYKLGAKLESGDWSYSSTDNSATSSTGVTPLAGCTRF